MYANTCKTVTNWNVSRSELGLNQDNKSMHSHYSISIFCFVLNEQVHENLFCDNRSSAPDRIFMAGNQEQECSFRIMPHMGKYS